MWWLKNSYNKYNVKYIEICYLVLFLFSSLKIMEIHKYPYSFSGAITSDNLNPQINDSTSSFLATEGRCLKEFWNERRRIYAFQEKIFTISSCNLSLFELKILMEKTVILNVQEFPRRLFLEKNILVFRREFFVFFFWFYNLICSILQTILDINSVVVESLVYQLHIIMEWHKKCFPRH